MIRIKMPYVLYSAIIAVFMLLLFLMVHDAKNSAHSFFECEVCNREHSLED